MAEMNRVAIKFCSRAGVSATETLELVQKAYGNEALNRSNVFRWYSRFRDGRELVEDDERCGRPKSTRTEVNIAAVADLVKNDSRIASRRIESLNIPKRVVLQILKEDLGNRKLYAPFFPHSLTHEQREDGVTSCQDIIARADADKHFFNKIITGDETLCFACDPETKRQSTEWVGETSPRPKKLKIQRSRIKTMMINIFDSQGIVHKEFVPEGRTVNAEFYKGVMDRHLKRIQRVGPISFCSRDFFLLHDNAPAHKAASVCQFLTPENVTTLYHPPYCPDLSPPDYFLFPKLKMKLKGLHLADVAEIQGAVTDKEGPKKGIFAAFQKLHDCAVACMYANGAYFE
jgi:histone-lysine N-methyltransferase SETMAR